jgi:nucleotide-binding universal stress UspA family protein
MLRTPERQRPAGARHEIRPRRWIVRAVAVSAMQAAAHDRRIVCHASASGASSTTQEEDMYKRILVATDGSELSGRAVDHAIALAKVLGSELVALKVTQLQVDDHWEGQLENDAAEKAVQEKHRAGRSQAIVDAVTALAQSAGVAAVGLTERSNFIADTVIEVAKKRDCDLIVMASHGRRGLARVLLGSETQHVLTHSHVPVLVLR